MRVVALKRARRWVRAPRAKRRRGVCCRGTKVSARCSLSLKYSTINLPLFGAAPSPPFPPSKCFPLASFLRRADSACLASRSALDSPNPDTLLNKLFLQFPPLVVSALHLTLSLLPAFA